MAVQSSLRLPHENVRAFTAAVGPIFPSCLGRHYGHLRKTAFVAVSVRFAGPVLIELALRFDGLRFALRICANPPANLAKFVSAVVLDVLTGVAVLRHGVFPDENEAYYTIISCVKTNTIMNA